MQTLTAKITPRLLNELDRLIKVRWYSNRSEAIRDAIRTLVENKRHALLEKAVREDIEWGLGGE
ncbi:MAG: ribbon-helix-helix protein, CopG family [Deltaproteobacteria bacterium]|nr:ribbon-helix-helix protein, CopG family [Deltaproteobacteria bacterium]